jgi:hypothetical protein
MYVLYAFCSLCKFCFHRGCEVVLFCDLKKKKKEMSEAQDVRQLQKEKDDLAIEVQRLQQQVEASNVKELQLIAAQQRDVQKLQRQMDTLKLEKADMEKTLHEKEDDFARLQGELDQQKKDHEVALNEMSMRHEEQQSYATGMQDSQLVEAQEQLRKLEEDNQKLAGQLKDIQGRLDSSTRERDSLAKCVQERDMHLEELQQQSDAAALQAKQYKEESAKLKQENTILKQRSRQESTVVPSLQLARMQSTADDRGSSVSEVHPSGGRLRNTSFVGASSEQFIAPGENVETPRAGGGQEYEMQDRSDPENGRTGHTKGTYKQLDEDKGRTSGPCPCCTAS